jgi:hypothetical protein
MVARNERRQAFYKAGEASLAHFKRTGIAYAHADVKRYVLGIAAGKRPRKPRPKPIP